MKGQVKVWVQCAVCGSEFVWTVQRGRKPKYCSECKKQSSVQRKIVEEGGVRYVVIGKNKYRLVEE